MTTTTIDVYFDDKTFYFAYTNIPKSKKIAMKYRVVAGDDARAHATVKRVHVCEEMRVYGTYPEFYTYIHRAAISAAVHEQQSLGSFIPMEKSVGGEVTTDYGTITVFRTSQAYLGVTGVLTVMNTLSTVITPDHCVLAEGVGGWVVLVDVESFIKRLRSVIDKKCFNAFVHDINKCGSVIETSVNNAPTECPYNYVIMNLVERWVETMDKTAVTPQEYQQMFLRDCSEAYAATLVNKSPFKITFS